MTATVTKEPVVLAAMAYVSALRRKETPKTDLDKVAPGAAEEAANVQVPVFVQKTVIPRGIARALCVRAIERSLAGVEPAESTANLLPTERDYVLNVLDEVYQWADTNGFQVARLWKMERAS